ncbi:DUF3558 domain-containing protein [Saccharomonospora halophila]|uniref:DUF3558 domain-containing protein n=1 Tax=Saccharomonospora halophila TaxID=129922 RepID=UPI000A05F186|nr:DUF3558 domain-containing protein [Saccharomonospora halophila]
MNFTQRPFIGMAAIALSALLTSCAESHPGTPTNTSLNTEVVSTTPPENGTSSSIEKPIDTTNLLKQPCTALPDADLTKLDLVEGRINKDTVSEVAYSCIWERSTDSGSHADLIVVTENANGLQDIRELNQDSELYEELQIGGYPALHASPSDRRYRGRCDLWIGVNDSEVLYVYLTLRDVPEAEDPCGYADRVGEAIIANVSP